MSDEKVRHYAFTEKKRLHAAMGQGDVAYIALTVGKCVCGGASVTNRLGMGLGCHDDLEPPSAAAKTDTYVHTVYKVSQGLALRYAHIAGSQDRRSAWLAWNCRIGDTPHGPYC